MYIKKMFTILSAILVFLGLVTYNCFIKNIDLFNLETKETNDQAYIYEQNSEETRTNSNNEENLEEMEETNEIFVPMEEDNKTTNFISFERLDIKHKNYSELQDKIKELISSQNGTYGIHFVSLTSGEEFGLNDTQEYIAASTVKLPVNLYLYYLAAQGKIDLNEEMTYTQDDFEEGTGDIQESNFGSKYSLRELSKKSIQISDNVAINMLIRRLGWNEFHNFQDSILNEPSNRKKNYSSPLFMSEYLKWLIDFSKNNPEQGEELLSYLKTTIFNDRIPKPLPDNIEVAHKIGNQVNALHDVGIVYASKPYILTIMSENVNEIEASNIIVEISKLIYDFEEN